MTEIKYRAGYVALIGRPNVGKSTLLNHILGQKISITAPKPQTTRHTILGIHTTENAQALYLDTPGLHQKMVNKLNKLMNRNADNAIYDADVVVFLVKAMQWQQEENYIIEHLKPIEKNVILAVNQIDTIKDKSHLLPFLEKTNKHYSFKEIVPISALKGSNIIRLIDVITKYLPENTPIYPEDQVTNRSIKFLAGELIRESLTRGLAQEVPYNLTVEIESFEEKENVIVIHGLILVERVGQKAIILGAKGERIKELGKQARIAMEQQFDKKVYLNLWVKVRSGWSDNERILKSLGYDFD